MLWQAFPLPSQTIHWYWNVIGAEPVHVPGLAVTVAPTSALPLTVGGELFAGATCDRDTTAPATPATTRPATATAPRMRARRRIEKWPDGEDQFITHISLRCCRSALESPLAWRSPPRLLPRRAQVLRIPNRRLSKG